MTRWYVKAIRNPDRATRRRWSQFAGHWRVERMHGAWWIYQPDGEFWDIDLYDLGSALDRVREVARMKARAERSRPVWVLPSLPADEGQDFAGQVDEWAKGNHARWSE